MTSRNRVQFEDEVYHTVSLFGWASKIAMLQLTAAANR